MASSSLALSSPAGGSTNSHNRNNKRAKTKHYYTEMQASLSPGNNSTDGAAATPAAGKLEELKQREAELSKLLASVRREKLSAIRARPLTIGVMGFGRFGQFIARTFSKYGRIVVTSRSDYTDIANGMGVKYVPLSNLDAFLAEDLDVIVVATSILSFKSTIQSLVPHLEKQLLAKAGKGDSAIVKGPLIVDVLSVKEHARQVMLDLLPPECDILCTHPMFGPDSGKKGWHGLNFVYEKTRLDKVVLEPESNNYNVNNNDSDNEEAFVDTAGQVHSVHEDSEAHVEAIDRVERFLSIWEEEGCRMVPMSAKDHDAYAANSQFITHLMGRILGSQGLSSTPIDTKGFESVLKLVGSTTADSFDLFYGLYKFNQNSLDTILQLRSAMDEVVDKLKVMEDEEQQKGNSVDPNNSKVVPS
ncbi:Dehydrogenase [Seminavis robusta]|uniref:Dehydrogenase n=1 Tax=Seminavis robusta TaxID=568900 RepID=A0A9N8EFG8_9STRA|nr:Dehydrogenase [Seminavis robusta]|eukprot:Sro922_g220500.1 Dehydrogenase (416) ;mRNA; f:11335-12582